MERLRNNKTPEQELRERCSELFHECEGIVFTFPGVHPHADERIRSKEASLTSEEQEMMQMAGEPTYNELITALQEENMLVVQHGRSYFVTPATSQTGTLSVAALSITAFTDQTIAELIANIRNQRK